MPSQSTAGSPREVSIWFKMPLSVFSIHKNTTAAEDIATYFGTNTTALIKENALFMRLNISAKIRPPTRVMVSSPMEYRMVTFREFNRCFVPEPLNSQTQFLNPT